MVDIQSAAVEIRRGKKEGKKERNHVHGKNIMSVSATQGGHNKKSHGYSLIPKFIEIVL